MSRDPLQIRPIPDELKEAFEGAARRSAEFNEWLKNPINEAKWLDQIARDLAQEGAADDAMLAERAKGGE